MPRGLATRQVLIHLPGQDLVGSIRDQLPQHDRGRRPPDTRASQHALAQLVELIGVACRDLDQKVRVAGGGHTLQDFRYLGQCRHGFVEKRLLDLSRGNGSDPVAQGVRGHGHAVQSQDTGGEHLSHTGLNRAASQAQFVSDPPNRGTRMDIQGRQDASTGGVQFTGVVGHCTPRFPLHIGQNDQYHDSLLTEMVIQPQMGDMNSTTDATSETGIAPIRTVGQYLARRLSQLGARHVFGLPGDFNLTLLDQMLTEDSIQWVGSTNELNASYAADAYARAGRGLGAFVTTFGVGELSAVNGMAGSYAEDVPVVHVVGMPSRAAMDQGVPLHHTLLDADFNHGVRVAREFSVADAVLRPESAAREIDRVLTAVVTASKPGFIGVPLDVAAAAVPDSAGLEPLAVAQTRPDVLDAFERALRDHLSRASSATLLAGPRIHRRGLEPMVREIAELPGVLVASQSASKAILDERHPASLGTYLGQTTADPATRDAVDNAQLLIMIGTITSDFTTGFFSHKYVPEEAVELSLDHARIAHAHYPGVMLHDSLEVLQRVIADAAFRPDDDATSSPRSRGSSSSDHSAEPHSPELAETTASVPATTSDAGEATASAADSTALTHELFWPLIQDWVAPNTTVIAEAGTSFYGALDLELPADSDLLGQPVWSSIGYTLPAVLGAGLAQPERRPVLFIGDGSAQLTVQELGTIFSRVPNAVVFLIDNRGYTVERYIQSPDAVYQDVTGWDWPAVPATLGASHVRNPRVGTVGELRSVLAETTEQPQESFFITVDLPERDAPRLLKVLAEGIAATNSKE